LKKNTSSSSNNESYDAPQTQSTTSGEEKKDEEEESSKTEQSLIKSTRLSGYITLVVASAICYSSLLDIHKYELQNQAVDNEEQGEDNEEQEQTNSTNINFDESSDTEINLSYGSTVALLSSVSCFIVVLMHFDQFTTMRKTWTNCFSPQKNKRELVFILFLAVWWSIATWFLTTMRGIAGYGKNRNNLYISTWVCCWTSFLILEEWCKAAAGLVSLHTFVKEWPYRAPGWMVLGFCSFVNFLFIWDIYNNWEEGSEGNPVALYLYGNVSDVQWKWLIFICLFTSPVSLLFLLAELFRTSPKSNTENMIEGIIVLILIIAWIPTVVVTTTYGGAASLIGNAYFFTWGCTVIAIETFYLWLKDWRRKIHQVRKEQMKEYDIARAQVMNNNAIAAGAAAAALANQE